MPEAIIQSVDGQREWTGNYGAMIDYSLTIESGGKTGQVYITKKPDSPAPQAGESFDYEVVKQDKHGTKIKRVFDSPYAGPTSNAAPTSSPSQSARNESIERQVAAKCAAQVVAADVASGKLAIVGAPLEFDKLTNAFHNTIRGYKVEEVDPANNTAQDSLPKPDTVGLTTADDSGGAAMTGDDDSIPFAPSRV